MRRVRGSGQEEQERLCAEVDWEYPLLQRCERRHGQRVVAHFSHDEALTDTF